MKEDKIVKLALVSIVHDHTCAMGGFKTGYCFDTKHRNILYESGCKLRKIQGEQEADKRKLESLSRAIAKRQVEIDRLILEHSTIENFTREDLEDAIGRPVDE